MSYLDEQDDPKKPKPYVVTDAAAPPQNAPYKVTDDSTPAGIDLRDSTGTPATPAPRRAAPLPAAHPAAEPGLVDRFGAWMGDHFAAPGATTLNPLADPSVGPAPETRRPAAPIDRRTVAEQAQAARSQGAQLIDTAAKADVSGTPGAQILPSAGGAGFTTAAAMDASATMAAIKATSQMQGEFSPQKWMDIAKRGMELSSALHAQGKHDEAEDVLRKAYNAQLLSQGAKQADTFGAIALSNLLGIVHDPYAGQRRNMAEIRANRDMTFTPEEQRAQLGMNLPAETDRQFSTTKDVLAPLVGQVPLFEAGGFLGRGALGIAGAAAERAGYEGVGTALGKIASIGEGAEVAGPRVPVRTAALARTRLEEEVAALKQQLPHMVERGATQGQIVGAVSTYRSARQQGATPEQALSAAAEGAGLNVIMGVGGEMALGAAGRALGVGYDPIGRAWTDIRNRVRGTTPEEAVTSFHPAPTPLVDAERAKEGKLPVADQMPGLHRDIAQSLEEILNVRQRQEQAHYEDAFATPHPIERPAGPDWWNAAVERGDVPRMDVGREPLGPEPSLIEQPNVIGGRGREPAPRPEPLPSQLEAAMRRTGVEPEIAPRDEANAHYRMRRAAMDAEDHGRMAAEEAQRALDDPNLKLEQAAQQRPGEKQGPLTLAQTLATAKDAADRGEPLAADYRDAVNRYADAAAAVRDAGEGPVSTRSQIALARARAALQDARTKYGKQLGASAVLALAANDSDLDEEEKKWVGLGGLAILGTDVVKMDESHPLMQRVPFYSRLSKAIESLPKAFEGARPAADWIGKLKGTNTFRKDELALILPSLEEAQRNKVKLSRDDVRAIIKEKVPQIERINLAESREVARHNGEGGAVANHGGDPDEIHDIADIEEHGGNGTPDGDLAYYQQQIDNREARIAEIQQEIDSETETYVDRHDSAEHDVQLRYRALMDTLEEHGYSSDVISPAIDYVHEHVESEYVPAGVVANAIRGETRPRHGGGPTHPGILDDLMEKGIDDHEEFLTDNGYSIAEEDEARPEPTRMMRIEHRNENGPRFNEDRFPRETLDDGSFVSHARFTEGRSEEDHIAAARRMYGEDAKISFVDDNHDDVEPEKEWVVRDSSGREIARDADKDEAMQSAISDEGLGPDMDSVLDDIETDLQRYAEAVADERAAESERYWREEGEAFDEQQQEIERLQSEQSTIGDLVEQAQARQAEEAMQTHPQTDDQIAAAQNQRALGDGTELPAEGRPDGEPVAVVEAPETEPPEQAMIPESHGQPKFASFQRIGGGRDYSEILNVWPNNPGKAYTENHYGRAGYANVAGHERVETHTIQHVPGLSGETIEISGNDPEPVRIAKSEIVKVRKNREKVREDIKDIFRRLEGLADPEGAGLQELEKMRADFKKYGQQINDLSLQEDKLVAKAAALMHVPAEPKDVRVMVESQSDWSQDAGRYGVREPWTPPPPEEVERLRSVLQSAQEALQEHDAKIIHLDAERRDAVGYWQTAISQRPEIRDAYYEKAEELNAAASARVISGTWPRTDQITDPAWSREWKLVREILPPDLVPLYDRLKQSQETKMDWQRDANRLYQERQAASDAWGVAVNGPVDAGRQVPASPFVETQQAFTLNAASFLVDAAVRKADIAAWSDAANRVKHAHLPMEAAKLVYDDVTPSAMKRLMSGLGFDVTPRRIYIRGEGHWGFDLTPEMRKAIKRAGLPILGVMALAGAPSQAEAQTPGAPSPSDLYATALGGIVAGAALMYLAQNKRVRRIIKENRELERALMMDDLSGLSNKKAFLRARESVDHDETYHWIVFDGDRFKKLNDTHGHAEGDKAIQHFGKTVMQVAEKLDIPMRGFRFGGDEIAFAAPQEHAAEFMRQVEEGSHFSKGDVTTKLTGGMGKTFEEADAMLNATKEANRRADPTLRRAPVEGGITLYSNPVGPALRQLARYPSAAALAGVGALAMTESDDPDIKATGAPLIALAALSAIGSRRLGAGKDFLGDKLLGIMQKSEAGTAAARFFNPDALLHPDVRQAILDFEATRAKGEARANEYSGKAKALGPSGDRAVSDVIENEGWEDTSAMSPKDMSAVLTFAASLEGEYSKLSQMKVQTGVLDPSDILPNYAGPRRYAHYEAADVLDEKPRNGGMGSRRIGAQKSRTLDQPIRDAERALADAKASGDPQKISDAQDELDLAHAIQQSQRVERGEIRESSYRAAQGIQKGYNDVAAATLFQQLRAQPGVAHPEWVKAVDELSAAKQMRKQATTPADRAAADDLIRDAKVAIDEITRKYQKAGGDYVSLPDTPGLGQLRGAVVQRDVANSLEGFAQKGLYQKTLNAWKKVKTIFNPGTHAGNIISNITFAHMEGLPMWEQPVWLAKAAKDMRAYGPMTRTLTEAGVLGHNVVNDRAMGAVGRSMKSEEGLADLYQTTRPETKDVLGKVAAMAPNEAITDRGAARASRRRTMKYAAAGTALGAARMYDDEEPGSSLATGAAIGLAGGLAAAKLGHGITSLYGREDDIFRVAIGMRHMARGLPLDQAAAEGKAALGNFRSRSPALNILRSTVAPFILYPAKVLPRFAAQVVDHPWRYMTLIALWGGLNEYSQQQVGDVPDVDVPPGQRRLMGYFLPGFTQLPMKGSKGERAATDMGRWTPLSGITTAAPPGSIPAALDDKTPDVFRAGGPVVDLASKFGANVDPFTQKPMYQADRPPRQNIRQLLNDVSGTMLPSALDVHGANIAEDIKNRDTDKLKNDALGPTGLRPRFIRPGANAQSATFQLQQSLAQHKQALTKDLLANKNPARLPLIQERYMQRVRQAIANYHDRLGVNPPAAILNDALSVPHEP